MKWDVDNNEWENIWPGGEVPTFWILPFVYERILDKTENIGLETGVVDIWCPPIHFELTKQTEQKNKKDETNMR